MISLPQNVERLLSIGTIKTAELIRFDFTTGTYGVWSGNDDLEYDGLTYVPGGIIQIPDINGQWGMSAQSLTLILPAYADDGLTPEVLATILNEGWHLSPVTIYEAIFDPETYELLFVEAIYRGRLNTLNFEDGPQSQLTADCESLAIDNNREGYRMRSNADQHLISPNDNFFSFAETESRSVIQWGQNRKA